MKYNPVQLTPALNTNPSEVALVIIQQGQDVGEQILAQFPEGWGKGLILTADGFVENPTLKLSGITTTHVDCCAILKLQCSYERNENNQIEVTENGMNICIANSNHEVYGGQVSGPLVAATPIHVVLLHSPHVGAF